MLVNLWVNWGKPLVSRLIDWLHPGQRKSPVPLLISPEAAAAYLQANCLYTGDPDILGIPGTQGAGDFNLHPEVLQAAMEADMGKPPEQREHLKRLHIDCDDWSLWALVALQQMGAEAQMLTLEDTSGNFGHHYITTYRHRGRCGAIDTNGHTSLPDLTTATICAEWSRKYAAREDFPGYTYGGITPTVHPFQ